MTWSCLAVELEEAGPEITADVDHDLLVAGEDLGVGLSSAVLGQKDQVDMEFGNLSPLSSDVKVCIPPRRQLF